MLESQYYTAKHNRDERSRLAADLDDVKSTLNHMRHNAKGGKVVIRGIGVDLPSSEVASAPIWDALSLWIDATKKKILELDNQFTQL